ncbi:hypothetical protein A2954_02470 [Candidatus Roizmanbacteria bacterium RIFCSPLOWO2_01_FULL_37_12]|uniref:Uncharacterized protein n=1 Tax=Candidatus Roizmanbacteria bacterium RIFCSPLOWO2_01_FULL_37_12 TaxID=1802056 RepID=A0A1F7IEW4_9BACT|nr:MAG: hypothetical protein A3D76_00090 [Candidatus Roizmanbacteria bacterium RIFCSPHIGHO2_02_FULL_37_9b]OGK41890.1 MAG: hypothetical protein A2954_02470 [Candidatus Roizmanbacteria bacterium RIFCSPLOWO2_01_FULL_37_12]
MEINQPTKINSQITEMLIMLAPGACPEVADRKTRPQGTGRITLEMLQQNSINISCSGELGQAVCALCVFFNQGMKFTVEKKNENPQN